MLPKRALYLCILLALAAGVAEAVTYLKSNDKVILNDGSELIGTVIFKAETLVVIMVEGEEKQIKMSDVKTIEMAPDVTGMVEKKKGEEPKVEDKAEEKTTDEKEAPAKTAAPDRKKTAPKKKAGKKAPEAAGKKAESKGEKKPVPRPKPVG
jgi:outer membrane biosynthesis protein TonB